MAQELHELQNPYIPHNLVTGKENIENRKKDIKKKKDEAWKHKKKKLLKQLNHCVSRYPSENFQMKYFIKAPIHCSFPNLWMFRINEWSQLTKCSISKQMQLLYSK